MMRKTVVKRAQLLDQGQRLALQTTLEPAAGTKTHMVARAHDETKSYQYSC
jgi:hypothetical protein